jgi:gamma-glutamyl-gamma-aminobutyrate hydrolase PuuD
MPLRFYSHHDFGGADSSAHLFQQAGMIKTYTPEDSDLIIFNGGADIATEIYGEKPVMRGIPHYHSQRDIGEVALFEEFKGKKFMLGICRGAQLLHCLNGGTLWQHVNNHTRDHTILDLITGKKYKATSTHHQMMRLPNVFNGKVIAVASEASVKHADEIIHTPDPKKNEDIEIVWYPKTSTLCIQGHPEYVPGSEFADYCLDLVYQYIKEAAA